MSVRYRFPVGFVWGSATAALQVEGATNSDGRGPSVWDVFCRDHPEKIFEGATPDMACDHYHRFREDVREMREIGHNGYRFSISWPRLFPDPRGPVNQSGADFYDRLIDCLLENGIEPNVTLYHWDLPHSLGETGGWECQETVDRFTDYARSCFARYGDRVTLWSTINEPGWSALNGYITGLHPPCKQDQGAFVRAATGLMEAHARAVAVGHESSPNAKIGIVLNLSPIHPATPSEKDLDAARMADGMLHRWFLEPAIRGEFPEDIMYLYESRGILDRRLDRDLIRKGTVDFLGVNYYYPHHASAAADETAFFLNTSGRREEACQFSLAGLFRFVPNPEGRFTDWGGGVDPEGLHQSLIRADRYRHGIPLYVTENGIGRQESLIGETVDDSERIEYLQSHLKAVHRAIADGANVKGYYMWSLMDNFSWLNGFKKRYGFLFIDRTTLARFKKKSAYWYREVSLANGF